MTNRKSHMPFRLVQKSTNLDDLERSLYALCCRTDDVYVALNKLLAAMNLLRYKWLILDILVDKEWILRILSCLTVSQVQDAAKKDPCTKTSTSSKRRNIFVRNFQPLLGRKFAIDGARICAILCTFAEMVRLLVFNALFSSERALFSV